MSDYCPNTASEMEQMCAYANAAARVRTFDRRLSAQMLGVALACACKARALESPEELAPGVSDLGTGPRVALLPWLRRTRK